jgi:hypothetical protein
VDQLSPAEIAARNAFAEESDEFMSKYLTPTTPTMQTRTNAFK